MRRDMCAHLAHNSKRPAAECGQQCADTGSAEKRKQGNCRWVLLGGGTRAASGMLLLVVLLAVAAVACSQKYAAAYGGSTCTCNEVTDRRRHEPRLHRAGS